MGSSGDVDLLRFVADEGDVQFGVFGSVEREVSRGIGRRTDRRAFDQNRCAYDWRPAGSVTVPDTCLFCAVTVASRQRTAINESRILLIIRMIF